jgi:hypothetical protein
MITDWQKSLNNISDDTELTDQERKMNWLRMEAHMPFY